MLVTNNEARVRMLAISLDPKNPIAGTVMLKLNPGINDFAGDQIKHWELAKKDKEVQGLLEEGIFVEIKATGEKGALAEMPETLEDFDAKMAIELVGGVMGLEKLQSWDKIETRQTVKAAIKKQMDEVKAFEEKNKAA